MDGYGLKYQVNFYSAFNSNEYNTLSIFKKNYIGSVNSFILIKDTNKIEIDWDDWDDRIIGKRLSFAIQNNNVNFYIYNELMFSVEREFIVQQTQKNVNTNTTTILFEGYMNVEAHSQKYLRNQNLNITASSYLSKLEHTVIPSVENLKNEAFINIISECLAQLGFQYAIRVCIPIRTIQDHGLIFSSNHTILNRTGIYKEVFWKDDYERMNCLEILESILKAFDLYLYWWDGKWYIEHFSKLWSTSKTYIEYQINTVYSYTVGESPSNTSTLSFTERDIHSLILTEMTQTLQAYPGLKQLNVKISEYQKFFNYTSNYFVNAEPTTTPVPIAKIRQWKYFDGYPEMTWHKKMLFSEKPVTFNTIKNAIMRGISDVRKFGDALGSAYRSRGLSTFFKVRILPDSTITIKYKYGFDRNSYINYQKVNWDQPDENDREEPFLNYSLYEWRMPVYLVATAFPDATPYTTPMIGIKRDDNTGEWSKDYLANNPPILQDETFWDFYTIVKGEEFDQINNVVTVEINVPIGELFADIINTNGWDFGFVFTIGTEMVVNNRAPYRFPIPNTSNYLTYDIKRMTPAQIAYFGDVTIESNENTELVEPNLYEGTINENYLNKEEIVIDIADIKAINYKNAILTGNDYEERTTKWVNYNENKMYSIVEWLFYFRFRQRNVTRRIITTDAREFSLLKPFTPFYDSKDPFLSNRKFLLTGFSYYPESSQYRNLYFIEYDDSTPVIMEVDDVVNDGTILIEEED